MVNVGSDGGKNQVNLTKICSFMDYIIKKWNDEDD